MAHSTARSCIAPHKYIYTNTTDSERKHALEQHVERTQRRQHLSSATNAGVLKDNQTIADGQRHVLRSSGRSDVQRAVHENIASIPHRNSVACTGGRTTPRRLMVTVVLFQVYKTRRTVSSGVQATPAVTGTNWMRTESLIQPESEVRVKCWTTDRDVPQEYYITAVDPSTKGRAETTDSVFTAEHMPYAAVNQI